VKKENYLESKEKIKMRKIYKNVFLIVLYLIISYFVGYFLIDEHWFINAILGFAMTVFISYIGVFVYLVIRIFKIF
jgi:hypothetical protein